MFKTQHQGTKPKFINKHQEGNAKQDQSFLPLIESRLADKVVRPAVTGALGALYYTATVGFDMTYFFNKFLVFGGSAVAADYIGNMFVDSSAMKSVGLRRVENMVIEPLISGGIYALLNKYYIGANSGFLGDFVIGAGTDVISGFAVAPIMRMMW